MSNDEPVVGIVGGMGPEATADLYGKIIAGTPAATDQLHVPVVMVADPRIPDRSEAILADGEDPLPYLVRAAQRCVAAGADFIIMPCNSAHYFLERMQEEVEVPIIDMVEELARHLHDEHPEVRAAGLMATTGTVRSGLYERRLHEVGIDLVLPDERDQDEIMQCIYEIKSGSRERARKGFDAVARRLIQRGAQVIIAGCTEIPLGLQAGDVAPVPYLDATLVLSRVAVGLARGERPVPDLHTKESMNREQ